MSTDLYWSRIPIEPKEEGISSLKHTLAKKVWGAESGSSGQCKEVVGKELIPFLEGIAEGNGSGDMGRDAKKLINAINQFGKVEISIH